MSERILRAIFCGLVVAAMLPTVGARAEHVSYDTAEECMRSGDLSFRPTCSNFGGRGWRASHPRDPASEARSMFASFLIIWLLLVGGSVWWVVATARRHGDPVGTALVGALIGGPLFVLLYGTNSDLARRSRKLYRWTDRLPDEPSQAPPALARRDKRSRLRELATLRDEGLITGDEYTARRRAIIDEV